MRIVSLFWGDPAGYVEQVHDANGVVLQTVGSAEEARRAAASGVEREKAPEKTPGGSCAEAEGQAAQRTTQRAHRGRCGGRVQTPRPASLTAATSSGGAAPRRGSMVPLRQVSTLTCV